MFEKEAEEIEKEAIKWVKDVFPNDEFKQSGISRALVEFAELGYNKANEWHDLRKDPNDLPDNGRRVLVKDKSRREYDVACLCRSKGNSDFWSYERFISRVSDNYVIAWCELPKFEE